MTKIPRPEELEVKITEKDIGKARKRKENFNSVLPKFLVWAEKEISKEILKSRKIELELYYLEFNERARDLFHDLNTVEAELQNLLNKSGWWLNSFYMFVPDFSLSIHITLKVIPLEEYKKRLERNKKIKMFFIRLIGRIYKLVGYKQPNLLGPGI